MAVVKFTGDLNDYCAEGLYDLVAEVVGGKLVISYVGDDGEPQVVREVLPIGPILRAIMTANEDLKGGDCNG